jgi:splicing factor 3A subunit 2
MVDRQNREGAKFGGGGMASDAQSARFRRERLKQLVMETFDVSKDPYLIKNQLGSIECRLCGTVHSTESSYMAHTQGRRHQTALQARAARDAKMNKSTAALTTTTIRPPQLRPPPTKIGRPGYRVSKFWGDDNNRPGLKFDLLFPDIEPGTQPRHSFMSAFEQKVEVPDPKYQYLIFAASPYESVAFKVPSRAIDRDSFTTNWTSETKEFHLEFKFK